MKNFDDIISRQNVRLIDVFIIAPFLIYAANKTQDKTLKTGLLIIGISTALYNAVNYLDETNK